MIAGVTVRSLRRIADDRGMVMHMLRADDPWFEQFGEIYFSVVNPGKIKGWHLHRAMTLNYAVVAGRIELVCHDAREGSSTRGAVWKALLGEEAYSLVTIPPGIWNGFRGLGPAPAIVANCATLPHDPEEIVRKDPFDPEIPHRWDSP